MLRKFKGLLNIHIGYHADKKKMKVEGHQKLEFPVASSLTH